jgi:hypothetical protein
MIGAFAVEVCKQRERNPAPVAVVDISEVVDADALKQPRWFGTPPKRYVIIAFDSVAQAKDRYSLPAQQEVNAMVEKAEKVRSFIVDSQGERSFIHGLAIIKRFNRVATAMPRWHVPLNRAKARS